mmetsp:Transcript_15563/g.25361  ORF Transcript_15563/g.25361 Transcript_15563/m.25361 type:complete len:95 (+) Transcript_15563:349-633(+)
MGRNSLILPRLSSGALPLAYHRHDDGVLWNVQVVLQVRPCDQPLPSSLTSHRTDPSATYSETDERFVFLLPGKTRQYTSDVTTAAYTTIIAGMF